MDRTEYELRKLVLMVGTQRAFIIMKDVERAVCPPPTEETLNRPSDNGSNVIHAPFGAGKKYQGRQPMVNGPQALVGDFLSKYPLGTYKECERYALSINPDINLKSLTNTYYKVKRKAA